MAQRPAQRWHVETVDPETVDRLAQSHAPYPGAAAMGVDIISDPHAENDEGFNWTLLSRSRNVSDVTPGATVVVGSTIGTYLAKVIAWDFEVSGTDPIVVLDLLPVTPKAVADALARAGSLSA
ncbi:MAG: hypothetical protein FWD59_09445 [Micrococcales bacterium]|nr:hypothetical protein [Acidimicrobiaceae bacterium]MCL2788693.1 hypothetical protein [Micrococcales bacterium]